MSELLKDDYRFFRLLEFAPFQRRSGGWRFGTRRISESTVERLIASGRAKIEGDYLLALKKELSDR